MSFCWRKSASELFPLCWRWLAGNRWAAPCLLSQFWAESAGYGMNRFTNMRRRVIGKQFSLRLEKRQKHDTGVAEKKWGPPLGIGEPRKAHLRCQCRFHTGAWGHPSWLPSQRQVVTIRQSGK